MRRILPLFALCTLLAVSAGPVLAAEHGEKPAAKPDGEKKKEKGKAPEHKITQSASYLMVDPIYTTIVGDNRATGLLMVGVGLDVPNAELRAVVERSMPVLRDAYVRNLMAFATTSVRIDSQPDIATIADRLQGVTDRALKKKGARVLLAQIALRAK